MKFLVYIFLIFQSLSFIAQEDLKDTIWFDANWKETVKKTASFYRVYKKTNAGFLVYDKFLSGQKQMIAEASAIKPDLVSNGYSIYFNENGSKDKRGYCKDDERVGIWTSYFDNEKDSSVYEHIAGNEVKYIRRSSLQNQEIYSVVEIMPEFPGGLNGLAKYIQKKVKYPRSERKKGTEGKVFVKFIVNQNGEVEKTTIIKSSGNIILDAEAIRVVQKMPKWKAGKQNGEAVSVYFNLPINFALKN